MVPLQIGVSLWHLVDLIHVLIVVGPITDIFCVIPDLRLFVLQDSIHLLKYDVPVPNYRRVRLLPAVVFDMILYQHIGSFVEVLEAAFEDSAKLSVVSYDVLQTLLNR